MGLVSRASLGVFPPKDFVQKLKSSLQMVWIILFQVVWGSSYIAVSLFHPHTYSLNYWWWKILINLQKCKQFIKILLVKFFTSLSRKWHYWNFKQVKAEKYTLACGLVTSFLIATAKVTWRFPGSRSQVSCSPTLADYTSYGILLPLN